LEEIETQQLTAHNRQLGFGGKFLARGPLEISW